MPILENLLEALLFNDRTRGVIKKTRNKHKKFLNMFFKYLEIGNVFFVLKAESLYTSLIDGRLDINKVELQKNSLLVINDSIEKRGRKILSH